MTFRVDYTTALRDHLAGGGEKALQRAYELGRRAICEDFGLLDLIELHMETLESILAICKVPEGSLRAMEASRRFLTECISPYEMTHRSFGEAIAALRRMNERLEEEARRIAHALHDDAGQLLVSVHLALQEAAAGLPARARSRLEKVRVPLDEMEKHLRRMSHELRPAILDDLGLVPALEFLSHGVGSRSGLAITVEGPRSPRLSPQVETALYRVVQEALHNASKHSKAAHVAIRIVYEVDGVRCSVRDDGKGFDVLGTMSRKGDRGLGLIGMRERLSALGGRLNIESAPGRGTEIQINLPVGGHYADSNPSR